MDRCEGRSAELESAPGSPAGEPSEALAGDVTGSRAEGGMPNRPAAVVDGGGTLLEAMLVLKKRRGVGERIVMTKEIRVQT